MQLSSLAPDFASAVRQLSNAVLHFESVSSLQITTPCSASGSERPHNNSKAWRCCGKGKPEHAQSISWLPPAVHRPLQASAGAGSGALNKAELTQRIMLAQLQSAVYEDIAAAASSDGLSVLGLRLPGVIHSAVPKLSPGQCFLYEDSMGSGLPSAQERRCALTASKALVLRSKVWSGAASTIASDCGRFLQVPCMPFTRISLGVPEPPWGGPSSRLTGRRSTAAGRARQERPCRVRVQANSRAAAAAAAL